MNLYDVETTRDADDPPGYETPYARVGPAIGASALGLTVYDLATGQSVCPYHYELGCEEWLFVLLGRPTLRDPDGEHELEQGDLVLVARAVPRRVAPGDLRADHDVADKARHVDGVGRHPPRTGATGVG